MMKLNFYIKKINICFLIVLLLFGLLLFYNLDNEYLNQDSAETGILAISVIKNGLPKTDLGNNKVILTDHKDSNDLGLWNWHTWGQYYLVALSFLIFGKSTFAGKLPFVIISFISLFLIKRLFDEIYHNDNITNLAFILMFLGTIFLRYSRMCRYYSIQFLIVPYLILIFYRKLFGKEKRYDPAIFIILNIILFHFNYAPFIIINGVFLFFVLKEIVFDKKSFNNVLYLIRSWVISAIFITPWLIYVKPWDKNYLFKFNMYFIFSLINYISEVNLIMPFLLLIIVILYFVKTKSLDSRKELIFLFLLISILLLVIFPVRSTRYILGVLPLYYLILSVFLHKIWSKTRFITIIMLILILTSFFSAIPADLTIKTPIAKNIFNNCYKYENKKECDRTYILLTEKYYLHVPFYNYIHELTSQNLEPTKVIVDYLNTHSKENDIIFTNYDLSPMMFYTNLPTYYINIQEVDNIIPNWIIPRDETYNTKILTLLDQYKNKCDVSSIFVPYSKKFWNNRVGLVNQTMYKVNCVNNT